MSTVRRAVPPQPNAPSHPWRLPLSRPLHIALLVALTFLSTACESFTRDYYGRRWQAFDPPEAVVPDPPFPPRALVMYAGGTGELLTWYELMEGVCWANVIVLGETHDDPVAHAVQLAVLDSTTAAWPDTVLAMEMLERDEQPLLNRYLSGEIDRSAFLDSAREGSWSKNRNWGAWYQPMLDLARERGVPVVAANAPRRFVRMARIDGFGALQALPASDRALFDLPGRPLPDGGYELRFRELMGGGHDEDSDETPARRDERVTAAFRAQSVWDATMAQSVADALDDGADRVILLVGQFHSDFNGGTVQQIARRAPFARILVVSLQPVDSLVLRERDRERADVVVYTGARERDETDSTPAPATTPEPTSSPDTPVSVESPPSPSIEA